MPKTCECLSCTAPAVARFTAPHLQPRFLICQPHLDKTLEWAERYRKIPGAVIVEPICGPTP